MSLGELPYPVAGSVDGWSYDALRSRTWSGWWKAELYGDRFQSSKWSQEEDCASCICFPAVESVDPINKRKVNIMVVHYEQFVFIQCL